MSAQRTFSLTLSVCNQSEGYEPCFDYRASCDQHLFDQTVGEDGEVRDAKRFGYVDSAFWLGS